MVKQLRIEKAAADQAQQAAKRDKEAALSFVKHTLKFGIEGGHARRATLDDWLHTPASRFFKAANRKIEYSIPNA